MHHAATSDRLPVEEIRPDFEALYTDANAKPLIITAPTGSGKSTRLPLWMRDLTRTKRGKVLVIEPRRVACRALATFLSEREGSKPGQQIGYSVRFEHVQSDETRVLFVTPGVALRLLSKETIDFEAVLIDEFHERGWEVDLVAAIIQRRRQQALATGETPLKFVLTSATLDAEHLQQALDADLLQAEGRTYPVDILYQGCSPLPTQHDLEQRVERAVHRALSEGGEGGEVLVFLPGKGEIAACASQLSGLERRHEGQIEVLEVHASLPMQRLMRAFSPPTPGKRRVFLSTNVAETSLTLPGVTWVVDSGLVRMQVHRAGKTALSLLPTSLASMDQRAGRAGRVRPGKCIRLWESTFKAQATTAPELERVELDDLILRAAICGLDVARLEEMPWVTPPPEFAVEKARQRLQTIGALTPDGALTSLGERLLELPVSTEAARLLVDAPAHLLGAACDLVALMQRGYRLMLRVDGLRNDVRERVMEARKELLSEVDDEVMEAITVLRHGDARRHHLHEVGLRETRQISANLRALSKHTEPSPEKDHTSLPNREDFAAHLLRQAPEMGFVMRERAQKKSGREDRKKRRSQPWGNGEVEVDINPYVPLNIQDNPHYKSPTTGVVCDHTWLGDRKGYGAHGKGSLLLPCSTKTLAAHGQIEEKIERLHVQKRGGRHHIEALVTRELAGVTLTSHQETLQGSALRRAVAELVFDNRIFKGAGEKLLERLHVLDLLSQWVETLETQHWKLDRLHALTSELAPPQEWLVARLQELGLTRQEELELLEAQDLLPDIAAMTGLYQPEVDELHEDFPRIWEYQGSRYECVVSPRQQSVELRPANKTARQSKEPPTHVLPRFRGFRIRYRQASRVLTLRG